MPCDRKSNYLALICSPVLFSTQRRIGKEFQGRALALAGG